MGVPPRGILSPLEGNRKPNEDRGLKIADWSMTAQGQRAAQNLTPDLAEVVAAWPALPEPIRAGILAMIRSASGSGGG